jgi:hypothetical protein
MSFELKISYVIYMKGLYNFTCPESLGMKGVSRLVKVSLTGHVD